MTPGADVDRWPDPPVERLLDSVAIQDPDSTGTRDSIAPYTGDDVAEIPCGEADDVAAAVSRARAAQESWADRDVADRAAIVRAVGEAVRRAEPGLLDLVQVETGKSRWDAFEEAVDVVGTADHYAANAEDYAGSVRRQGPVPGLTKAVVHRHPYGVVGLIAPWNYPLSLAVSDALPALVAGNAVVLKPALQTTLTALRLRELVVEAGVPPACFQVVPGKGPELGPAIVEHCDFVGFTGSVAAGRDVGSRAGDALTPVSLELGGKNPFIVLGDADVDRAALGATRACFANAGQLCIATERVYVHDDVFGAFRDAFVAATGRLDVGASFDFGPDVGALISPDHRDGVESAVDDAVASGATVLTGGDRREDVAPTVFAPTILTDVDHDHPIVREETFGPVVTLHRVPDAETAVDRANETDYGLHASVWTADADRGEAIASRIEAGTVCVNDAYIATWGSTGAPMGGRKDSGVGRRHGREGLRKYTAAQTVGTQRGHPLVEPDWLPTRATAAGIRGILRVRDWLPFWPR